MIPEFRVWDKKNKQMHTLISLYDPRYIDGCEYAIGQSSDSVVAINYKDCEVLMSTGRKDKKGFIIYEEDIIKESPNGYLGVIKRDEMTGNFFLVGPIGILEWDWSELVYDHLDRVEVIGNTLKEPCMLDLDENEKVSE